MILLEYLENMNTYFNIEILQPSDSIINTQTLDNNLITIILDGLIQILKVFTNGEVICTQLLKTNHIIRLDNSKNKLVNYYYKANAITKTVILTTRIKKVKLANIYFKRINYHIHNQEHAMIKVLCHKNTKKRIIQLLLILSKEFGQIRRRKVIIPFYISHYTLSQITGSHRANIARIMNKLKKEKIITYDNHYLTIHNILKLSQS